MESLVEKSCYEEFNGTLA